MVPPDDPRHPKHRADPVTAGRPRARDTEAASVAVDAAEPTPPMARRAAVNGFDEPASEARRSRLGAGTLKNIRVSRDSGSVDRLRANIRIAL